MRTYKSALWDIETFLKKHSRDWKTRKDLLEMLKVAYLAMIADCLEEIVTGEYIK